MRWITGLSNKKRMLLLLSCTWGLPQVGLSGAPVQGLLQRNVVTNLSCAPSNNGTGHVLCSEELGAANGSTPTLGGVSWQAPNGLPAGTLVGPNKAPVEASGTVDQMPSVVFPNGPFTGTPGCAQVNDNTGSVICAVEGTNNGLYGIAIHPEPLGSVLTVAQTTSQLIPLLLPGTVINVDGGDLNPCDNNNPCDRVGALASNPSCAPTEGAMVICAVLVLVQNTVGSAQTGLAGIAFDPRMPLEPGINPAIRLLPFGTSFVGNPSCTSDVDPSATNPVNGGKAFAACAIVFNAPDFGATATLFGVDFDPRSGYTNATTFSASNGMAFIGTPSCATPRDNSSEVICAIGEGVGSGLGSGTSTALFGFAFNPVTQTSVPPMSFGAPPSGDGFWSGIGCASPNDLNDNNSIACAATTSKNEVLVINFDPRTGKDPITNTAPAFSGNVFFDANGLSVNPSPSCVSLDVIRNQITCGIVDGAGNTMGVAIPITH